jgi:hypothetical protein
MQLVACIFTRAWLSRPWHRRITASERPAIQRAELCSCSCRPRFFASRFCNSHPHHAPPQRPSNAISLTTRRLAPRMAAGPRGSLAITLLLLLLLLPAPDRPASHLLFVGASSLPLCALTPDAAPADHVPSECHPARHLCRRRRRAAAPRQAAPRHAARAGAVHAAVCGPRAGRPAAQQRWQPGRAAAAAAAAGGGQAPHNPGAAAGGRAAGAPAGPQVGVAAAAAAAATAAAAAAAAAAASAHHSLAHGGQQHHQRSAQPGPSPSAGRMRRTGGAAAPRPGPSPGSRPGSCCPAGAGQRLRGLLLGCAGRLGAVRRRRQRPAAASCSSSWCSQPGPKA